MTITLIGLVVGSVAFKYAVPNANPGLALFVSWVGIIACVAQSALCSGLTIALTGINRLELEAMAASGNKNAAEVLTLRSKPFLLPFTLLWANVIFNVALPFLVGDVMGQAAAFVFSIVVITHVGEIIPVAIVSRHPLVIGAFMAPAVRIYMIVLWPLAAPEAMIFTRWMGAEGTPLFSESVLLYMLELHIQRQDSEIGDLEGWGAHNFLNFDDILVNEEGEYIQDQSVFAVPFIDGVPQIPENTEFLRRAYQAGKKWAILTDSESGEPGAVLKIRSYACDCLLSDTPINPKKYYHTPLVVHDSKERLAPWVRKLRVHAQRPDDDVVDNDVIIVWNHEKRIITGSDILGRLLRKIVKQVL